MKLDKNLIPGTVVALVHEDSGEDKASGMFGIIFDENTILTDLLIFQDVETGQITMRPYRQILTKVKGDNSEEIAAIDSHSFPKLNQLKLVVPAPDLDKSAVNCLKNIVSQFETMMEKDEIDSGEFKTWSNNLWKEVRRGRRFIDKKRKLSGQEFLDEIIAAVDDDTAGYLDDLGYSLTLKYPYLHLVNNNDKSLRTVKTPVTNYFTKDFAIKIGKSISESDEVAKLILQGWGYDGPECR